MSSARRTTRPAFRCTVKEMPTWDVMTEWFRGRPVWVADGLFALLVALGELGLKSLSPPSAMATPGPVPVVVLATLALTLPLALRRVAPSLIVVIVGVVTGAHASLGIGNSGLPLVIALYTEASLRPLRESLQTAAIVLACAIGVLLFIDGVAMVPLNVVVIAVGWGLGYRTQVARERATALEARARELEHEREERLRLAVAAERTRIARELHDVAGHGVAVIAVQAAGARRVLRNDIEGADRALEAIEHAARSSLTEIRRAVSLLRDGRDDVVRTPQPRVAQVGELIDRFRAAGLQVDYRADIDDVHLDQAVSLAVYRVVQEGLTNVLKHAGPASATVTVCCEGDGVDVIVTDDGRGGTHPSNGGHDGFGLAGLSERVVLHGGRMEAGPRNDGHGFRVAVHLPRTAAVGEHAT